jgi:rRNA maturation RNase YbeY
VNRRVFGRSGATDVISLRYAPTPPRRGLAGEIIVNVQRALAVGPRYWRGRRNRELALYVAHGCDHLQGWDDRGRAARMRMRRRELHWIREAAARDLPDNLVRPRGDARDH